MADRRLRAELRRTVNGELLDRAIRHLIYLRRLSTGEASRIISFLDGEVYPDILSTLQRRLEASPTRALGRGVHTTQRLRRMEQAYNELIRVGMREASSRLRSSLDDIALSEAEFQAAAVKQAITRRIPIAFDLELPSVQTLRSIVRARPMQGALLRDWFQRQARADQVAVTRAVNLGLSQGEGIPTIVQRVRQTMVGSSRRGVAAIVRTAVNHTTTHAREESYRENGNIISGVRYVATLDANTTIICASLDGNVYAVGEGPRPPQHVGCRSDTAPVVKSFAELGIPGLKELAPPGSRFARIGEAQIAGEVPGTFTYRDWLLSQPRSVQVAAVGAGRADLIAGGLPLSRLVDRTNAPLTLEQVRRLEGLD